MAMDVGYLITGACALVGSGTFQGLLHTFLKPATLQHIAELETYVHKTFVTKEDLSDLKEDIKYLRDRFDKQFPR